jgi:hypothetical protein
MHGVRKRRHKRKRRAKQGIREGQRKSNDPETVRRQSWLNIVPMVGEVTPTGKAGK